jgi:AcrR family transcriptional regulator
VKKNLQDKMADRRGKILEAAEALIRRDRSIDFSMQDLASEAGFSLATSYNLIGTKSTVLYWLLNRSVEQLKNEYREMTVRHFNQSEVFRLIEVVTSFFSSDPEYYRPLIRFLEGVPDPVNRPIFMNAAFGFWLDLSRRFAEENETLPLQSVESATMMHTFFLGALNRWVHGEIDNETFEMSIKNAASLVFFPCDR